MGSDFYSPICRNLVVPFWAKWEGSPYLNYLKDQRQFQYLDKEQINNIQFIEAKKLLSHAYHNSIFYKKFYSSMDIHPEDIKTWSDFSRLPILTKSMVREEREKLVAQNIPKEKLIPGKTSGSTGKPLEFFIDEDSAQKQRASIALTNEWGGHRLGDKLFSMFGQSTSTVKASKWRKYLRKRLLSRVNNLNTLSITEGSMTDFYFLLKKSRRPFICGYAHALYLYAKFLEENSYLDVDAGGVISGGMVLHKWEREKIKNVYGCKVLNRYGCEELGLIACECEHEKGLHVNSYSKYVEVINSKGKSAKPGEIGNLLITELTNYGMPFIRYKIEDMAVVSEECCSCGRTLSLLERIEGRESDFIITSEGKMVSGISLTDNFGANIPGVVQLQIVQDKLDHIKLRIVKDSSFNSQSIEIIDQLNKKFFGSKMKFSCEYVDRLKLEASGKIRFVISELGSRCHE